MYFEINELSGGKSMEFNYTFYGDTKSVVYLQWGLVGHVLTIFQFILNKHVAYLSCSCYKCIHSLEGIATLCSDESLIHTGCLLLAVLMPVCW